MSALNKKVDLTRTNSICPPPETLLLESVKKNDTETIKTLINSNKSLLNYVYSQTAKTILPTACSESGISPTTVQTLIDLGGDLEGDAEWKPLHLAAQNPNSLILEVVINNLKPGQINETVDGDNALHSLIRGIELKEHEGLFQKNVQLLVEYGVNVNQGDGKNVSPILWAAKFGYKTIIRTILEKSIGHVDLDSHKLRNKTARELIAEKNLFEGALPEKNKFHYPKDKLFSLIKESQEDKFIKYFDTLSLTNPGDFVNADDNSATLLQYACDKGLVKIAKYLLDRGSNVNFVIKNNPKLPIEMAAEHGYFEIFQFLVDQPEMMISPSIVCYLLKKMDNPKFDKIDHEKCCDILLKKLKSNRALVDINGEDELKNTPLHYSVRYGNESTSQQLLDLGASLASKNPFGVMPIEDIKPEFLERHLDECIKFNIKNKNDEKRDFEVIFDYQTLLPPRRSKRMKFEDCDPENFDTGDQIVPETEVIAYMSQAAEFKSFLKHPVIVSLLFMKWHKIRWLFYTNLFFYVIFVMSLVTYIFSYYDSFGLEESSDLCLVLSKISYGVLNLTFWILILREFFQITVSPGNYFHNFENLVEIILIIITGMILYIGAPTSDTRKQLSSLAILLAAFELVLMVGQHPKLSTNVVMFKTVSVNFFKLLLWYSLLIIAFALSFYILFAKTDIPSPAHNGTETEDEEDSFTGPGKSLFKTIVMLTGEFDAGSINFHTYPITSKLIFSLFVFMITIILLNLLNGLAVSDTQTIKKDAELVGHITRAQHIYYVESMLLGNILPTSIVKVVQKFLCCCPCEEEITYTFLKPLARKVCLFNNAPNCQLLVLPNHYGKIDCEFAGTGKRRTETYVHCTRTCSDTYLDKQTIRRVNGIVKRRREGLENPAPANVEGLYAEIAALKEKMDQIWMTISRKKELGF